MILKWEIVLYKYTIKIYYLIIANKISKFVSQVLLKRRWYFPE